MPGRGVAHLEVLEPHLVQPRGEEQQEFCGWPIWAASPEPEADHVRLCEVLEPVDHPDHEKKMTGEIMGKSPTWTSATWTLPRSLLLRRAGEAHRACRRGR